MKRFNFQVALSLLITAYVAAAPCWAQSSVRSVFRKNLEGAGGSKPVLTLWPGPGLNLSFIATGEVIRSVWLDDPSQIALKTDCSPQGQRCAPQVLHLRQIQKIAFRGLTKGADTALTLITQEPNGQRHIYPLHIRLASRGSGYDILSVVPESRGIATIELSGYRRATVEDLQRGLQRARQMRYLSPGDPLSGKVQTFLVLLRNGEQPIEASVQAGISMSLVNKLAEIGMEPVTASNAALDSNPSGSLKNGVAINSRSVTEPEINSQIPALLPASSPMGFTDSKPER